MVAATVTPTEPAPGRAPHQEKQVCEDWLIDNSLKVAKVIGAAAAVLVINQLLLLIYEFLVAFERHSTVTEVAQSQFWKLFLAQMVNTASWISLSGHDCPVCRRSGQNRAWLV